MPPVTITCYCLHDDHWHLAASMRSFKAAGPIIAFISKRAWNGTDGDWERCVKVAEEEGAEVVIGDWPDETLHRRTSLATLKERGHKYVITPDGDEIIEPSLLKSLLKVAETELAERVHVKMDTYWKTPEYVIRPRERLEPVMMVNVQVAEHLYIREYEGGRRMTLEASHGVFHHFSYVGPEERIQRKISTWGHRDEVMNGWYANVWKAWDSDKLLRNFHPTHPEFYGYAERIELPEIVKAVGVEAAPKREYKKPKGFPKVSVSIPLHGGCEDIRYCLHNLASCCDLLHEVFVVDNASTDGADKIAEEYDFVKLIRNSENLGFAKASNQGYEASTGDVVIFLNSDTIVTRAGLLSLVSSLTQSGSVGAVGPYSNNVSGKQQIAANYTSLDTIDLFTQDFAERSQNDVDADMLVGFCLAVRRSVLDELGGFDESFGLGTFEDNDLCYRIRRAGYQLKIASKSFVHHFGSKTIQRTIARPDVLLRKNQQIFIDKWRNDLDLGFASHLSGLSLEPIRFNAERKPETLIQQLQDLKERADISLCMIVKNEERVLGDCLKSAKPFFNQIIVVDTGSTDSTKKIAQEYGAEVYDYPWTDSFSDARNQSLKYAKGRWLFWLDADDTLPWASGEAIINAALQSPPDVHAYVVPVQFVDEGIGAGTRVDHVKLFRNMPGLEFEGRIHEQILPSLRKHQGQIARLGAIVLHSGYDTSEEGQARKRQRDEKLLILDLNERPEHPFVLFNLGMTAHYTQGHEDAVQWLEKCLLVSEPNESHVRKTYALLAVSLRELGRLEDAKATLLKGLKVVGHDPELHFQAGLLLTSTGEYAEAKEHYLAVEPNIEGHFSSIDVGILGHKRLFNLGALCMLMQNYAEAKEWWLKAISVEPSFLHSHFALFDAALEANDLITAQEVMDRILTHEGPGANWTNLGMKHAEKVGGPANVEAFLDQACKIYPHAMQPALMLARRHLEMGREMEAMHRLYQLEQAGSAEAAYLMGICATRRGNYKEALRHMELALELNPEHEMTKEQITNLRQLLSEEMAVLGA